jgi:hypothetical protein
MTMAPIPLRKKKSLLMWLSLITVFAILALLYSARHMAGQTLEMPWGIYGLVALCLGVLFLLQRLYDRS